MSKSIIQKDTTECFICGGTRCLEEHHIFQGMNRKNSEHYGMKVKLCGPTCHRGRDGAHNNAYLKRELQALARIKFEEKYGHDKFMRVFGMDFIETGLQEGYIWKEEKLKGIFNLI